MTTAWTISSAISSLSTGAPITLACATTTSGKWLAENPGHGQCNVTALLVNELFGGEMLKTPLPEGDHFYNRIDGKRVDFTDSQFSVPIAYLEIPSDRAEALAGTSPAKYEALRTAFSRRYD